MFSSVVCAVFRFSIPPGVRPTLLRQMDVESLTCAYIWERVVHTKGDWWGRGVGGEGGSNIVKDCVKADCDGHTSARADVAQW